MKRKIKCSFFPFSRNYRGFISKGLKTWRRDTWTGFFSQPNRSSDWAVQVSVSFHTNLAPVKESSYLASYYTKCGKIPTYQTAEFLWPQIEIYRLNKKIKFQDRWSRKIPSKKAPTYVCLILALSFVRACLASRSLRR